MAVVLQLKLLGGFDACRPDGSRLVVASKKNQALIAYLSLCDGQPQTREKLVGLLWSDRDDEHARNSLRQALVTLRRDLGEIASSALVVAGDRLALDSKLVDVDALIVEHLASSPRMNDLRTIARLYRGDLLDGLAITDQAFEEWLVAERTRLRELVITAILRGLTNLAGEEAVALAQRALALDPLREAAHRALMRALAGNGQVDLALRQYQACRGVLKRELGVEPDVETTRLRDVIAGTTSDPAQPTVASLDSSAQAPQAITRRLAAILAADVVGYSRLMERDEESTLMTLNSCRGVITQLINEHQGRVVGTAGDNVIAEFASAVQAVRCAVAIQQALDRRNADLEETRRMTFRIGINVGDVIVQGRDLLGDGVNIASRLEQMAEAGGIVVSETVREQIRGKVAFPCSYLGEQTAKNIARPLRTYRVDWRQSDIWDAGPGGSPGAPALPSKPSIAILPFANLGGDPEQEYFADGIVEEIITALAHFRHLFVIARNSSFTYKGRSVDVKQVGRELGVRYVLEGSVRRAADRLRITGQLIDASTGANLWADRFDGAMAEVFELQDRVTASVVGAIAPRVEEAEIERAKRKPTESLDAYDYYLRGLAILNRTMTRETTDEALRLFNEAIERDPEFALAYARAAQCYQYRKVNSWMVDRAQEVAEAARLARRAIEVGRDDSVALSYGGLAVGYVVGDLDDGAAFVDRALSLNSNLAYAWGASSWMKACFGELETAIQHAARAMRLSPVDPGIFLWQSFIALAHLCAGRYDDAASWAETALRDQPNYGFALRVAAASHAMAGRSAEAQKAMARLRQVDPQLRLSNLGEVISPLRRPEHRARYVEGLRKAGLPE